MPGLFILWLGLYQIFPLYSIWFEYYLSIAWFISIRILFGWIQIHCSAYSSMISLSLECWPHKLRESQQPCLHLLEMTYCRPNSVFVFGHIVLQKLHWIWIKGTAASPVFSPAFSLKDSCCQPGSLSSLAPTQSALWWWHTVKKLDRLTCFLVQDFSCTSFLHRIQHISIPYKKLACTWLTRMVSLADWSAAYRCHVFICVDVVDNLLYKVNIVCLLIYFLNLFKLFK